MTVVTKFPVTLEERLELGAGEVRFPATLEEFAGLLEVCEYPMGEKLPRYKRMASTRYIITVEQSYPLVTVHQRPDGETRWKADDYDDLEQSVELHGKPVLLADIYENVLMQLQ